MKQVINTEKAPKALGPYSQAILSGNTLYVSGQVPIDPASGKLVDDDITIQTEQVMQNIQAILEAAGFDFKNVVKSTCLLSDMKNFSVKTKRRPNQRIGGIRQIKSRRHETHHQRQPGDLVRRYGQRV